MEICVCGIFYILIVGPAIGMCSGDIWYVSSMNNIGIDMLSEN